MSKPKPISNNSFDDKWPPEVAARGYTQVPNCLLYCQQSLGISNNELVVLIQLLSFQFDTRLPWPSAGRLATGMGQSVNTVRRNLRLLEAKGLIKRCPRYGKTNEYSFMPLIHMLRVHNCINPIQKRAGIRPELSTQPYLKPNTKEDYPKRKPNNNSKTSSLADLIKQHYSPP